MVAGETLETDNVCYNSNAFGFLVMMKSRRNMLRVYCQRSTSIRGGQTYGAGLGSLGLWGGIGVELIGLYASLLGLGCHGVLSILGGHLGVGVPGCFSSALGFELRSATMQFGHHLGDSAMGGSESIDGGTLARSAV